MTRDVFCRPFRAAAHIRRIRPRVPFTSGELHPCMLHRRHGLTFPSVRRSCLPLTSERASLSGAAGYFDAPPVSLNFRPIDQPIARAGRPPGNSKRIFAAMPIPDRLNLILTTFVFVSALFLLWLGSWTTSYVAVFAVGIAFSYLSLTNYALLHEAAHGNLHFKCAMESRLGHAERAAVPVPLEHDPRHAPRASSAKPHRLRNVRSLLSAREPAVAVWAMVQHTLRVVLAAGADRGVVVRHLPDGFADARVSPGANVQLRVGRHAQGRSAARSAARCC